MFTQRQRQGWKVWRGDATDSHQGNGAWTSKRTSSPMNKEHIDLAPCNHSPHLFARLLVSEHTSSTLNCLRGPSKSIPISPLPFQAHPFQAHPLKHTLKTPCPSFLQRDPCSREVTCAVPSWLKVNVSAARFVPPPLYRFLRLTLFLLLLFFCACWLDCVLWCCCQHLCSVRGAKRAIATSGQWRFVNILERDS